VLWGALHGAALSLEHFRRDRARLLPPVFAWAATFLFVSLAWIPFRAPTLGMAWAFAGRLVTPGPATLMTPGIAIAVVGVLALQLAPGRPLDAMRERLVALPAAALGTALAITVVLVAAAVPGNSVPPFIYFQF
jgi:hypothetical protein